MNTIRSIFGLFLVGLLVLSSPVSSRKMIVAYYTDWSQYRSCYSSDQYAFFPENMNSIIPSIDVLNYAFAKIDTTGHFIMLDATDCVTGKWDGCGTSSASNALIDRVLKLKSINPSLQVMLSIGGWSWDGSSNCDVFSQMASTATSRNKFISEGIQLSRKLGFDGIDVDWEYPAADWRGCSASDTTNYKYLLRDFRAAIEAEVRPAGVNKLLLTIAAPSVDSAPGLGISNVHQYLDWINLMTYDFSGGDWSPSTAHNSPLYNPTDQTLSVTYTVNWYLNAGVPAAKLNMGMPTYGRAMTLKNSVCGGTGLAIVGNGPGQPCTNEDGMYAYFEILKLSGMTSTYDATAHSMYACNAAKKLWVSYENAATLAEKAQLVVSQNLGGAMFWAVDMDDFLNGYPLITSVRQTMDGATPPPPPVVSSTGSARPSSSSTGSARPSSSSTGAARPASSSTGSARPASSSTGSARPASSSTGSARPGSSTGGGMAPSSTAAPFVCVNFITLHQADGVSTRSFGFTVNGATETVTQVELQDAQSAATEWMTMQKTSLGPFMLTPSRELVLPFSVRLTAASGHAVTIPNIITSIQANTIVRTSSCFDDSLPPVDCSDTTAIKLKLGDSASVWWFALNVDAAMTPQQVSIRDASSGAQWKSLSLSDFGAWIYSGSSMPLKVPFSVDVIAANGARATIRNAIPSLTPNVAFDTGRCLSTTPTGEVDPLTPAKSAASPTQIVFSFLSLLGLIVMALVF